MSGVILYEVGFYYFYKACLFAGRNGINKSSCELSNNSFYPDGKLIHVMNRAYMNITYVYSVV